MTIYPKEQACCKCHHNSTIDCPLSVTGHIAAGNDVDSLKEKDQSCEKKQNAEDLNWEFHI